MDAMDAFVGTIAGVVVGGGVTYVAQWGADRRRTRREAIEGVARLYDRAADALEAVAASRRGGDVGLDPAAFPSLDSRLDEVKATLTLEGIQRHQKTQWDLRAAMAALPSATDLRRFWDKKQPPNERA